MHIFFTKRSRMKGTEMWCYGLLGKTYRSHCFQSQVILMSFECFNLFVRTSYAVFTRDTFTWGKCHFTIENVTQYNRNVKFTSGTTLALIQLAGCVTISQVQTLRVRSTMRMTKTHESLWKFPISYPDSCVLLLRMRRVWEGSGYKIGKFHVWPTRNRLLLILTQCSLCIYGKRAISYSRTCMMKTVSDKLGLEVELAGLS